MVRLFVALATSICAAALSMARPGAFVPAPPSAQTVEFFERSVRPVLAEHCVACHGGATQLGGVRLDTPSGASAAAQRIPTAIAHTGKIKMPPAGKLGRAEVDTLTTWARAGAPMPAAPAKSAGKAPLWVLRPVQAPKQPAVKSTARVRNPIDRFVLARLEAKGLGLAPEADRRTLIRRATFDLTGLPPTTAEIDSFLKDKKPGAWERVVDRLLASPHYGETWGRHWLDLVRYCDSLDARGVGSEGDIAFAWRYRDWVVDAFNRDLPYDQFLLHQVAGDLLRTAEGDIDPQATIATGFLAIGNWGNGDADKDKILTDIADDQVDTVSKAFLGLTVGCARCHDHKFDPISTRDYYSLAGVFFSTHILPKLTPKGAGEILLRVPLETKEQKQAREDLGREEAALQTWLAERRVEVASSLAPHAADYLEAVRSGDVAGLEPWAVRRWKEALGLSGYPLLSKSVRAFMGNQEVDGFTGPKDVPSQLVNSGTQARQILTFRLPPKSVSVHPSPGNGVSTGWVSPVSGTVSVTGSVADADPACGNGIEWRVDLRGKTGLRTVAKGEIANASQSAIGDPALKSLTVQPGDQIELVILPKGEYSCDTTVVDLTIQEAGGARWNLTDDAVRRPGMNPVPDSRGNPAVWRFSDPAGSGGEMLPESVRSAYAAGDIPGAATAFANAPMVPNGPFAPAADTDFPAFVRSELARRRARIAALRGQVPTTIPLANAAQEGGVPESPHAGVHDVAVHVRGRYDRLGDMVPRGVPALLTGGAPVRPTAGSGRLELGKWLGDPSNPLTPRVLVNRLWQHHFGEGIVRTASNFGALGEKPTHPELLDWLASELVRRRWSIKQMHKVILTSATWMQSSATPSAKAARIDPENRLLHRQNRRRLTAEALRDSLLVASGNLDPTPGGEAVRGLDNRRRTLYCMTIRSDRTGYGPLFDMADSTNGVDRRTESLVAPQALYLLHSDFVQDRATELAERLRKLASDDAKRVRLATQLVYGRPATPAEIGVAQRFLATSRKDPGPNPDARAWARFCHVLLCANEFLFVD